MSVYRKFDQYPRSRSDVHADTTIQGPLRATSRKIVGIEDRKHLRKAAPATMPLPFAFKWVATLPPNVRPTALLRQYPRIANLIAAAWRDPKAFDTYMESLLTDKRGNRRGFSPEILNELVAVQRYYNIHKDDVSVWHTVGKRG